MAAEPVAAGFGGTVAGVAGDAVVARGAVVAADVVVGAVVVSAGVTGAVVPGAAVDAGAAEDDGVGGASVGRDAATAAGGGALLAAGESADFGSAPAGFAGAVFRAARSDPDRLGTVAGRGGDELAGTRERVELADAREGVALDGVEGERLFAVLAEVAVGGDDFAALAVRSCFADRSAPEGMTFGGITAFGGAGASIIGPRAGAGTATSVTAVVVGGVSTGGAGWGDAAAISERATSEASMREDRGTTLIATMPASATTSTSNTPTPIRNEFGIGGSGGEGGTRNPGSSSSRSSRKSSGGVAAVFLGAGFSSTIGPSRLPRLCFDMVIAQRNDRGSPLESTGRSVPRSSADARRSRSPATSIGSSIAVQPRRRHARSPGWCW